MNDLKNLQSDETIRWRQPCSRLPISFYHTRDPDTTHFLFPHVIVLILYLIIGELIIDFVICPFYILTLTIDNTEGGDYSLNTY